MDTSQSLLVVVTINSDVNLMLLFEVLHHLIDVLHTLGAVSHGLSGVVGVATRTIPVLEELWSEGNNNLVVLSNTLQKITGDPHVVTDFNTDAWTNLVLKLTWHDLNISSRDLDTSVKASLVVSIGDGTTEADVGTNGAVVWTLGTWVTIVWPAKWLLGELGGLRKEGVLLLNTVPSLLSLDFWVLPNLLSVVSEVGVCWDEFLEFLVLPSVSLTHNDDVVLSAEWVSEVSDWLEDDLRHLSDGLVGG